MGQCWSMLYPSFIILGVTCVPSKPINQNILLSILVDNLLHTTDAGVQRCFTSHRQVQEFLLIVGCLEYWVIRCSKPVVKHNLVRNEKIMTDKQRKEENGTMPERKGWGECEKKQKVKERKRMKEKRKQSEPKIIKNMGEGSSGWMSHK